MNSSMMIHSVKEVDFSEKKLLDYGSGKCYMHDLRVTTEDGSTVVISMFFERLEENAELRSR